MRTRIKHVKFATVTVTVHISVTIAIMPPIPLLILYNTTPIGVSIQVQHIISHLDPQRFSKHLLIMAQIRSLWGMAHKHQSLTLGLPISPLVTKALS